MTARPAGSATLLELLRSNYFFWYLFLTCFVYFFVQPSGGWVTIQLKLTTIPHIKYVSCVNLTLL